MAKDTIGNSAYGLLGCKIATETIVRWLKCSRIMAVSQKS